MTAFDDLTWHEAMRQGHTAMIESESLHDDLRRAEAKATQAQVWLALASELGRQGERYGHPGT